MKEIDEEIIVDFLTSSTGGLSDATKKNYRIAMINFFAYIDKNNEISPGIGHHFAIELKNWRGLKGHAGQKLPAYLTQEEIAKFLQAIEDYPFREDVASRNRLLIKLILYTGIRVSEAINLKLKDIIAQDEVYLVKIV